MKFEVQRILWHDANVMSVDFAPGLRIATAGSEGLVRIWRVKLNPVAAAATTAATAASINEDNKDGNEDKEHGQSYDCVGSQIFLVKYLSTLRYHTSSVNCVRFAPNGLLLASAGDDGKVVLWQKHQRLETPNEDGAVESWIPVRCFTGCTTDILSLSWTPDSSHIMCGCFDGTLTAFRLGIQRNTPLFSLKVSSGIINGCAVDPLLKHIVAESSNREIRVADIISKGKTDWKLWLRHSRAASQAQISLDDPAAPHSIVPDGEDVFSAIRQIPLATLGPFGGVVPGQNKTPDCKMADIRDVSDQLGEQEEQGGQRGQGDTSSEVMNVPPTSQPDTHTERETQVQTQTQTQTQPPALIPSPPTLPHDLEQPTNTDAHTATVTFQDVPDNPTRRVGKVCGAPQRGGGEPATAVSTISTTVTTIDTTVSTDIIATTTTDTDTGVDTQTSCQPCPSDSETDSESLPFSTNLAAPPHSPNSPYTPAISQDALRRLRETRDAAPTVPLFIGYMDSFFRRTTFTVDGRYLVAVAVELPLCGTGSKSDIVNDIDSSVKHVPHSSATREGVRNLMLPSSWVVFKSDAVTNAALLFHRDSLEAPAQDGKGRGRKLDPAGATPSQGGATGSGSIPLAPDLEETPSTRPPLIRHATHGTMLPAIALPGHRRPTIAVASSPIIYAIPACVSPCSGVGGGVGVGVNANDGVDNSDDSDDGDGNSVCSDSDSDSDGDCDCENDSHCDGDVEGSVDNVSAELMQDTAHSGEENTRKKLNPTGQRVFTPSELVFPFRQVVAVASLDGVAIYAIDCQPDPNKDRVVCIFRASGFHTAGITDVAFSRDGRFLAASSADGLVSLLSIENSPGQAIGRMANTNALPHKH